MRITLFSLIHTLLSIFIVYFRSKTDAICWQKIYNITDFENTFWKSNVSSHFTELISNQLQIYILKQMHFCVYFKYSEFDTQWRQDQIEEMAPS